MKNTEVILYHAPGTDFRKDRTVLDFAGSRTIFVPVGPTGHTEVVTDLLREGVARIELCGALGPTAFADVISIVDGSVPVGVCVFGAESAASATTFEQRLLNGEAVSVALLFLAEGADPAADEVTVDRGPARLRFIPVPSRTAAAEVGEKLVAEGVDLIELYGGLDASSLVPVLHAAAGRTPVGMAYYGRPAEAR